MDNHCDPRFASPLQSRFRPEDLARHPASVFGIWVGGTLAYVNTGWDRFASENNGQPKIGVAWGLGANYFEAIAEPLRPFYRAMLARVPEPDVAMHPVAHQYECSSATLFRKFNMQVYSLPQQAYLIVNSLLVERPHDAAERPECSPDPSAYLDANGTLHQCSHCRRMQHTGDPDRWDWVPAWVERSPDATSHGICAICFGYYYADPGDGVPE